MILIPRLPINDVVGPEDCEVELLGSVGQSACCHCGLAQNPRSRSAERSPISGRRVPDSIGAVFDSQLTTRKASQQAIPIRAARGYCNIAGHCAEVGPGQRRTPRTHAPTIGSTVDGSREQVHAAPGPSDRSRTADERRRSGPAVYPPGRRARTVRIASVSLPDHELASGSDCRDGQLLAVARHHHRRRRERAAPSSPIAGWLPCPGPPSVVEAVVRPSRDQIEAIRPARYDPGLTNQQRACGMAQARPMGPLAVSVPGGLDSARRKSLIRDGTVGLCGKELDGAVRPGHRLGRAFNGHVAWVPCEAGWGPSLGQSILGYQVDSIESREDADLVLIVRHQGRSSITPVVEDAAVARASGRNESRTG